MSNDNKINKSNVLVTGGAGFIGSALVRELEKKECKVTVLDNLVAGLPEHLDGTKATLVEGDIRNKDLLREILKRDRIDYCFHLAAEPYIPKGYQNPEIMFDVNTLGTINILKQCHRARVKRIMFYSTSEVYGTAQILPMNEKHPTMPHSIYACAKLAADRACFILWKEQKIPVIILRQFNCFGPREAQPYIIPELISQFSRKTELHLGNLEARRDFTYVHDGARGAIKLMETPMFGAMIVNLGRGRNWSVKEIVEHVASVMKVKNYTIMQERKRMRPYDVDELLCDNTLFTTLTGGLDFISFDDGLKRTVEWYKKHGRKWSWER